MNAHMPELLPVHDRLVSLAGGSERASRFPVHMIPFRPTLVAAR